MTPKEVKVIVDGQEFIIGQEYEFSDMLQEDKVFKVEWRKSILKGYCPHPNSSNSFVSKDNGYYIYCRPIDPKNEVRDFIDYVSRHKYFNNTDVMMTLQQIKEMI